MEGTLTQSNIIMYTTEDGVTKIEVTFDHETVWLSIDQMAELLQHDKSVIGKHVRNTKSGQRFLRKNCLTSSMKPPKKPKAQKRKKRKRYPKLFFKKCSRIYTDSNY